MTGSIGAAFDLQAAGPTSTSDASASHDAARGDGPLMVVPSGFIADILSGLSGTIGEVAGDIFGNAALGKQIGVAAGPLVKLLPFQIVPPAVAPESSGPQAGASGAVSGSGESMIVVPEAFLGGLLGGIGGNLLGGAIGGLFGGSGKQTGSSIGSAIGGIFGGLLPFQVVPPALLPQSTGPEGGSTDQEPMVVVPAGFFGDLLSGVAGTVGGIAGGLFGGSQGAQTGQQLGNTLSPILKLFPFQDVPPQLLPQSTGPDGSSTEQERLIVVPAGFFGSLLSGLSGTIGGAVGGLFGDAKTGQAIGGGLSPILSLLPFQVVPSATESAASGSNQSKSN